MNTSESKPIKARFQQAWPYKDDAMNLPVANVDEAVPFYETKMGFRLVSRSDTPVKSAVLARDDIQMGLAENGGDPTQEGCAFQVDSVEAAHVEFKSYGLNPGEPEPEKSDHGYWKVFYVVAPDGLCYWIGERLE